MENAKKDLLQRLKESNNVLVTVSTNPSVDQLSATIGITLLLNKLKKHATAVFSGAVPSTLEFLEPEKTLEKNTDSLRDFIIALDKSKADKLRYKIEENHVKIFITPYRTSIGQEDLEFSQGDFNVDVVLALGVKEQKDLDQAISAHGRILHDATVVSVNTEPNGSLGSINWVEPNASSLSEMLVSLANALQADILDEQMATAFLTGIVAETDRFSNQKTTSETMNISAKLMSAGANQQLVATKLEEPEPPAEMNPETATKFDPADFVDSPPDTQKPQAAQEVGESDGTLNVEHQDPQSAQDETEADGENTEPLSQIHIDERGKLQPLGQTEENGNSADKKPEPNADDHNELPEPVAEDKDKKNTKTVAAPPARGGTLTASARPQGLDPATDLIGEGDRQKGRILNRGGAEQDSEPRKGASDNEPAEKPEEDSQNLPASSEPAEFQPLSSEPMPSEDTNAPRRKTLEEIEKEQKTKAESDSQAGTDSSETTGQQQTQPDSAPPALNDARDAVMQAVSNQPPSDKPLEPIAALNAQPVNLDLSHDGDSTDQTNYEDGQNNQAQPQSDTSPHQYLDVNQIDPSTGLPIGQSEQADDSKEDKGPEEHPAPGSSNPNAPPPGPPPMMPPQF